MKTVHIIFNAHLDPVWLWPWQAGLDELLATARSACDRLDTHPDLYFTQGEAWVFQQIELVDPQLFERIKVHVANGRWEIVGGWWLQPDCNFPTRWAMEQQINLGKDYLQSRFGQFPSIAFNVDSFGHAHVLPDLMRAHGQTHYVMMRPQEHEKTLPARVFRWRSEEGHDPVTVFRIADAYVTRRISLDHIQQSLTELPEGMSHTMCFLGMGDHGGGPTEYLIQWVREHQDALEGVRLEFSTVGRYFSAIVQDEENLPLVTGELQHHAVGCYSIQRSSKLAMRRAEHGLVQAKQVSRVPNATVKGDGERLHDAWEKVCFHAFHDTIGGSCIASAYQQVDDDLGSACATVDKILHHGLRRQLNALPDDSLQRVIFYNSSDHDFSGIVPCEPWMEYRDWLPHWRVCNANGDTLPVQYMQSEHLAHWRSGILLPVDVPAGEMQVLTIDTQGDGTKGSADAIDSTLRCTDTRIANELVGVDVRRGELHWEDGVSSALPELTLTADPSDTWSHDLTRYSEHVDASAQWHTPTLINDGPLMAALVQRGKIGDSPLESEWRVYHDLPYVEWHLRVLWVERHKVLKLRMPFDQPIVSRQDGVMGDFIDRDLSGHEEPIHDGTRFTLSDGKCLGVVCPEVFALDGTAQRVRLTLLRSPLMAHMDLGPAMAMEPRGTIADQGSQSFRFRFYAGEAATPEFLYAQILNLHRPPIMADLTRGMPPHHPKLVAELTCNIMRIQ